MQLLQRSAPRAALAAAGALLITTFAFTATEAVAKKSRNQVADFSATDLDGNKVSLKSLKGKVVIVNFWATWCQPCLQELPYLQKFYEAYKDKGLVILAVSTDGPETAARVRTVVSQRGFTMPIIHDKAGELVNQLNPRGNNPYTLFIDKQGRAAFKHEGYSAGDEKKYLKVLKALMKE